MAKTQTIEVPDELTGLFDKALERGDRFVYGTVQAHKRVASRATKEKLKGQSLFGFLATIWGTLTDEDKASWKQAGAFSNLTNWQFFISDNAARLRGDLPLNQPVSDSWQVRTGFINLSGSANEVRLIQQHPFDYWVARKMAGKPWKQELVLVRESFTLPLEIGLSYKADLTVDGPNPVARFFARVWSSYQGEDIFKDVEIPLSASTDWVVESVEVTNVAGYLIGYQLIFEIEDYQGLLLFDNLRAVHSAQNWARDPRADDVSKIFTKAFALVRPFWLPDIFPTGASFESVYPPSL